MGQTLSTSGNNIESPVDISLASTALYRRALPWTRGLQQNSFLSARMNNNFTRETRQAANLGFSRAAWIFTWSRHASLPVDTLELFPHNYQMPQLSSTDRLLMAAKDMTDTFQNSHSEVPFASVGDDTVKALVDLAAIFKLKLQQAPSLATQATPATVVQRPSLIPLTTQISSSPMPDRRLTRSQTTTHTQKIPDVSSPPRVVTSRTIRHSPLRVPTRSLELSPRNLSQD
jgi:hypothetical protein